MCLYQVSFLGSVLWYQNKLAFWEEAFKGRKRRQCRDEMCFEACGLWYYALEALAETH